MQLLLKDLTKRLFALALFTLFIGTTAAFGQFTQVYQLRQDGSIWQIGAVPDCLENATCPSWQELDNNPLTWDITAMGGQITPTGTETTSLLYQMHRDGSIWQYTGTPCSQGVCPGWLQLDNNPRTTKIVAAGNDLYQMHGDGFLWQYTGVPCNTTGCPGWRLIDRNSLTTEITAGAAGDIPPPSFLYQRHTDGTIWFFTGTPCSNTACPGWKLLDSNALSAELATDDQILYQRRTNGSILRILSPLLALPCTGFSCPPWQVVDNDKLAVQIAASDNGIQDFQYKRRKDGSVWYINAPVGPTQIDNNPLTIQIVPMFTSLFQVRRDGSIWAFSQSLGSDFGWKQLDNNLANKIVVTVTPLL